MSHRFESCIRSRGLRSCPVDPAKIDREMAEARNDLASAKNSLRESDHKWAIIKAYYSMFHACKSLVFSAGYCEKSHDCLIIAVQELFIASGRLPSSIVTAVRDAKSAREVADYGLTYSDEAADAIIRDATEVYRVILDYHRNGSGENSR